MKYYEVLIVLVYTYASSYVIAAVWSMFVLMAHDAVSLCNSFLTSVFEQCDP